MTFALSVILKTTILLACASLMTLGLRRTSASTKHAIWAIALLCALVLPFASAVLPEISVAVLPEENTQRIASPPPLEEGWRAQRDGVVRHASTFLRVLRA